MMDYHEMRMAELRLAYIKNRSRARRHEVACQAMGAVGLVGGIYAVSAFCGLVFRVLGVA